MLRSITTTEIEELIFNAKRHPRKRHILRLHEHHEPVQRMVNALVPGTYITPHKHENPDKVELFNILKGKVAILQFSPRGEVEQVVTLSAHGLFRVVDIPPRMYHSIIPLEPSAVLEIIQGPYEEATHKQFASWAPREDDPKAADYLMYLTSIVHNWKS
ncbi:MAG: WbuC family cupin fold metalloprotein [Chloroflexota bacterium]